MILLNSADPARFAAEPFGLVADFTQNTDGTTANVIFKN